MWDTPKPRLAALIAVLSVLLAACGGGAAGGEADPATAVPADASMYAEFVVRPEGALREDALDAAGKVLATDDPEAEIRRLVERSFGDFEFDYERDVAPWLGERVGAWSRPGSGALLLTADDTEEARAALEDALRRNDRRFSERSHRGSDYLLDDEGIASGIVGDFVAIGPEAAYKRTVDAFEGDSLGEADRYLDAVEGLEDERLAHVWLDTGAVLEAGLARHQELRGAATLLPFGDLPPVAAAFTADGEALGVEARARGGDLGSLLGGGGTPLLRELPGDAWFAAGWADLGESLRETVDRVAGAFGGLALRRELTRRTGLDLDRDLLDWIGDVGVFVRGANSETFDGGLVIEPTDEQRATDAFGRIVGAIQVAADVRARPISVEGADQAFEIDSPHSRLPIVLARGSGLVTITAGRPAAEAALGSGDRLGDSELYAEAEDLVGMEPAALVSMEHVTEIAARPHFEAFTVLALGVSGEGDEVVAHLAAGLD